MEQVLCADCGDTIALLHVGAGEYHLLDGTAKSVWTHLQIPQSFKQLVDHICAEYEDAAADLVQSDLNQLLADLRRRGLIWDSTPRPQVSDPRKGPRTSPTRTVPQFLLPNAMVIGWKLMRTYALLRAIGLGQVLRRIGNSTRRMPNEPVTLFNVKTLVRNVSVTASLLPLNLQCLERSVCALWLLHQRGVDAHLRIGVMPFPMTAHAWIEYQGNPVGEDPEFLPLFRSFPPLSPVQS